MELYIYSPAIEQLGVIDNFSSLRWRRRFFVPGEFELHCAATDDHIALLAEGNILHRLDRKEAGIIEGVAVQESDSGSGDEIVITGRMGSSMLDQRIITPTVNFSGAVEDAMRKIVSDNAITARPIASLVLGTSGGFSPTCTFQVTYKTILTALEALAQSAPLGFRVRLDVPNRQWVFEVYDGLDKTVTQTVRPYVLLSDEFQNISKPAYTLDNTGYANFAYIGGEGDGSARTIVTVDHTNGEPRRELWVDAKDLQSSASMEEDFTGDGSTTAFVLPNIPANISSVTVGGTSTSDYALNGNAITFSAAPAASAAIAVSYTYAMTADEYAAALTQRGLEKLAEAVKSESFSADAVDTQNFQYLTDWDLGDIVSFEKWDLRLDQRITEVEEVYENGVETVTPTCGTPLPEALDLGDDT